MMKCPRCGSEHIQFATNTYGGGGSVSKSCCGYILLGPFGILCGMCNSGTKTEEFWICHDCGNRFSNFEAKLNHGVEEWTENRKIERENARKAAAEEAKQAKEKYLLYKKEIASIENTPGAYKRLKTEYALAQEHTTESRDELKHYVKQLRRSRDRQLRKAARHSTPSILWGVLQWVIGLLGLFFLLYVDIFVGLIMMGIGIIWWAVVSSNKDKAKDTLISTDRIYKKLWDNLNLSCAAEAKLKHTIEMYEYVKEYENQGRASNGSRHGRYER